MKIWIDILTPKQLLFAELIVGRLGKKHKILYTSRKYSEVTELAKIRKFSPVYIGKHGATKQQKLQASISRMQGLVKKIESFKPDVVVSFCSPDATRIAFGLGIKHITFCDTPHAEAVLRLTLPLVQTVLVPSIIPKSLISKYGISKKNIILYDAIDAAVTIKRKTKRKKNIILDSKKRNIIIRVEELQASYVSKPSNIVSIIKTIIDEFKDENILILGRYSNQVRDLRLVVGKKARVVMMSFDGKDVLEKADVFIGSGGTMTAESALMGVPTISYNAVPNIAERYLVKKHLVSRQNNPTKIIQQIKHMLQNPKETKVKAKRIVSQMEDPIELLANLIDDNFVKSSKSR